MSVTRLLLVVMCCLMPRLASADGCNVSISNIVFGPVDTLNGGSVDVSGTISISCSYLLYGSVTGTLSFGAGSGGADQTTRWMANASGTGKLAYQLYADAARTQVLGSKYGSYGGQPMAFSSTSPSFIGASGSFPFYARVFSGQKGAPIGSYSSSWGGGDLIVDYTINDFGFVTNYQTTASFSVSGSVLSNCLVAAADMDFGTAGLLRSNVDTTGNVQVTCTPNTAFQIGLNNGLTGTGPTNRLMTNLNGSSVRYGLYQDASHALAWGGTLGTDALAGTGTGSADNFPVYGRVPAQTTPPPGVYTDTILVTLTY